MTGSLSFNKVRCSKRVNFAFYIIDAFDGSSGINYGGVCKKLKVHFVFFFYRRELAVTCENFSTINGNRSSGVEEGATRSNKEENEDSLTHDVLSLRVSQ